MYVRRLPQKQKGRKAVVREGDWGVISSMGQRFLLLMGGNCFAETEESGLLARYLVPAFRWRGLQMCVRIRIDTESRRQRTVSISAAAATQPTLVYACMLLSPTLLHHWILAPTSPAFTFLVCDWLICFSKTLPLF